MVSVCDHRPRQDNATSHACMCAACAHRMNVLVARSVRRLHFLPPGLRFPPLPFGPPDSYIRSRTGMFFSVSFLVSFPPHILCFVAPSTLYRHLQEINVETPAVRNFEQATIRPWTAAWTVLLRPIKPHHGVLQDPIFHPHCRSRYAHRWRRERLHGGERNPRALERK